MKKWKGILAVILITGCLGGCSQFQAEHNAVKVKRDGSVQAAVIDTLDKSYYSEDELKQTIDDSVSAYNQSQEGDPIVVYELCGFQGLSGFQQCDLLYGRPAGSIRSEVRIPG